MTQKALIKAHPWSRKRSPKSVAIKGKLPYNGWAIEGKNNSILVDCDNNYILNVMKIEHKLLSLKQVVEMVCLSKSTIYRWMDVGKFPKPVSLGGKSVRWRTVDIQEWMKELN